MSKFFQATSLLFFLCGTNSFSAEPQCNGLKLRCAGQEVPFIQVERPQSKLNNSKCEADFSQTRLIHASKYSVQVEAGDSGIVSVDGNSEEDYFGQQRPPAYYQVVLFSYQVGIPFKILNPTYGEFDQIQCVVLK